LDNLIKAVYTKVQDDCKLTSTGHLGAYLGSPTADPYNFVAEFPPKAFTGTWMTYRAGMLDRDLNAPGLSGDQIWQFVVWNQEKSITLPPILNRLQEVLNEQKFETTTSAADNFYCLELGETGFDQNRNSYYGRIVFRSRIKLYTRGL